MDFSGGGKLRKFSEMFDFEKTRRGVTICLAILILVFLFGADVTDACFNFMDTITKMKFGFFLTIILAIGVVYGILAEDMPLHKTIGLISFALLGGFQYADGVSSFFEKIRGNVGFTIAATVAAVLIIVLNAVPKKETG